MPELPEVETIRVGLQRLLVGRSITGMKNFNSPKSFDGSQQQIDSFLIGARIKKVDRRAKVLLISLTNNYSLVIHLKMTGQMVFRPENHDQERFGGGHPTDSLINSLPDRSTRIQFDFDDGSKLFFNDQRKFGWIKLLPSAEVADIPFMKKVGPEPLDPSTTAEQFIERVRRHPNMKIKPTILDQSVIAGVGNIYADEALWAAKIHPETRVSEIDDQTLPKLFNEICKVLRLSIEKGGSTDRNYIDAEGKRGSYLSFAKVFRREGQPCTIHPDQEIVKIKVGGRGTHICPVCQT